MYTLPIIIIRVSIIPQKHSGIRSHHFRTEDILAFNRCYDIIILYYSSPDYTLITVLSYASAGCIIQGFQSFPAIHRFKSRPGCHFYIIMVETRDLGLFRPYGVCVDQPERDCHIISSV